MSLTVKKYPPKSVPAEKATAKPVGRPPGTSKLYKLARDFADENAEDILLFLKAHAANNPAACIELANMVYGQNWLATKINSVLGPLKGKGDFPAARERALAAYVCGDIDTKQLDRLIELIDRQEAKQNKPKGTVTD